MEFEARKLNTYAEPVSVESLSIGQAYFGPDATDTGAMFFTGSTQAAFTYERALDLLLACSLRRRERGFD
jgi:hypothetical protein